MCKFQKYHFLPVSVNALPLKFLQKWDLGKSVGVLSMTPPSTGREAETTAQMSSLLSTAATQVYRLD